MIATAAGARSRHTGKPVLRRTRGTTQAADVEAEISSKFLPVIQLAITPVILLSGVGALMITLTNRLGRIVDRTRSLAGLTRQAVSGERLHFDSQLAILWQRAKLVRLAVTLAGLSMLLSCLLVLVIFIDASVRREFGLELVVIFVTSVVSLILSLGAFLRDIWLSLEALRLEVTKARETK